MPIRRSLSLPSSAAAAVAGSVVVVSWASAFPAIRAAAPQLGVIGLSLVRLMVAAAALWCIAPVMGVRLPTRRDLPLVIACGFFGMASYQVLLNWGELHVQAGTASIIVAAAPLVSIGIAAGAFGERLTVVEIVGSAIAIAGVALVSTARSDVSVTSAIWIVIGAAVVQGIYHPLTKPLLRRHTGLEVATYGMVVGVVMTLPFVGFAWSDMASAELVPGGLRCISGSFRPLSGSSCGDTPSPACRSPRRPRCCISFLPWRF